MKKASMFLIAITAISSSGFEFSPVLLRKSALVDHRYHLLIQ